MKTLQQAIEVAKSEIQTTIDSRMLSRLTSFLTADQIEELGFAFNTPEDRATHTPIEFTEANVIEQLKNDVQFGFEKALDQRGISASLMFHVVYGWCQVLELNDIVSRFDGGSNYAQYGLPLFKAVANQYGFPNPIGDDVGNEVKYAG